MSATPSWMEALPLTVLRVQLSPRTSWQHDEPALALRGALGNALIHLVCVRDRVECQPCPHRATCLAPSWYDPSLLAGASRTRPFWIRTSGTTAGTIAPDRPIVLTWTFLGALPRPSLVLEVLHRTATVGLGADRVPHDVRTTWHDGDGFTDRGWPGPVPLSALARIPTPNAPLVLRTVSRLRLRRKGRELRRPLLSDVVESTVLRIRELERALGVAIPWTWPAPSSGGAPIGCRWEEGHRFSSHQGRTVDLSGVQAGWAIGADEAQPHRDLFAAAEWLQLGTATSAGLGVVRWAEATER